MCGAIPSLTQYAFNGMVLLKKKAQGQLYLTFSFTCSCYAYTEEFQEKHTHTTFQERLSLCKYQNHDLLNKFPGCKR